MHHTDWQLRAMLIMTGTALGIIISHFVFGGPFECWNLNHQNHEIYRQ